MGKKDENGVILPVKREMAPAERLPSADEQRPKEDIGEQKETQTGSGKNSGKPIGEEEIMKAKGIMKEYFNAKRLFDVRYRNNFDVYNLLYNENDGEQYYIGSDGQPVREQFPERIGGQTLNVILNKHADAMDNYPEAMFLPRSKDDEHTAAMLNCIVPCILERNGFQKTYSDAWTDKLVGGACGYGVIWDSNRENGLGDIAIVRVNLLCMAWAPYIEDIQESPNLFLVSYEDVDAVKAAYPELEDVSAEDLGLESFTTFHAETETKNKAAVIDWYYKKNGVLHFCKFCGNQVIFASENEAEKYPRGFYEHGLYPYEVGALFPLRKTPVGFSFVDICRMPQKQLDLLKRDILKNIHINSQTRNLVNRQAAVNIDDLRDMNVEFVEADGGDLSRMIHPIDSKDIAAGALSMFQFSVDQIKDITGTNDPSNGAGAAGVTSGAAIAALQEAGGKISRDINKRGFSEFEKICVLILEEIRQFYNPARWFRIVGEDKKTEYVQFDNEGLQPQTVKVDGVEDDFERLPVFDIKIKAQRSNPFTTAANNQLMTDMYRMGVFSPENAEASLTMLEGMSFEGKDKIAEQIKSNSALMQQFRQLAEQNQMLQAMVAQQAADSMAPAAAVPPTVQQEERI